MLEISDVRIRLLSNENSKVRAIASFTIDDAFIVHEVRIVEGTNGLFIDMPSNKRPNGEFRDIAHPKNTETRTLISNAILAAYEKEKNKPKE